MIGIRKSDEPLLDAAASAARADRSALRAAIRQSDALAARSGPRVLARFIGSVRAFFLRYGTRRTP
ncbi:hypothetical protein BSY16_4593 (plasmid) [Sinorhizobium sp. RAC02]|nr:hypothetical protein BSY16_4593 [Sinorhizobium sp. RAC02]